MQNNQTPLRRNNLAAYRYVHRKKSRKIRMRASDHAFRLQQRRRNLYEPAGIIHAAKYFSELTEIHAYRRGLPVSGA